MFCPLIGRVGLRLLVGFAGLRPLDGRARLRLLLDRKALVCWVAEWALIF